MSCACAEGRRWKYLNSTSSRQRRDLHAKDPGYYIEASWILVQVLRCAHSLIAPHLASVFERNLWRCAKFSFLCTYPCIVHSLYLRKRPIGSSYEGLKWWDRTISILLCHMGRNCGWIEYSIWSSFVVPWSSSTFCCTSHTGDCISMIIYFHGDPITTF